MSQYINPPDESVVKVDGLVKRFGSSSQTLTAVNDVSFSIKAGEILGMVGESGSGKSTIGRTILRLLSPSDGSIIFRGVDITRISESQCRPLRASMQMVFQDPWMALNPRLRTRALIEEPLLLHTRLSASERRREAEALAERVRLVGNLLDRFPSELSGGQLQRVCIARALATKPKLIVLDEPTSSLDLSVRAGIIELLAEIRADTGAAMLFISHDIGTLRLLCDSIAVLYLGSIVEYGPMQEVFSRPRHPYTQTLISAYLPTDPSVRLNRHKLVGEVPSPINRPTGCSFSTRCPVAVQRCRQQEPSLEVVDDSGRAVSCLRSGEALLREAG